MKKASLAGLALIASCTATEPTAVPQQMLYDSIQLWNGLSRQSSSFTYPPDWALAADSHWRIKQPIVEQTGNIQIQFSTTDPANAVCNAKLYATSNFREPLESKQTEHVRNESIQVLDPSLSKTREHALFNTKGLADGTYAITVACHDRVTRAPFVQQNAQDGVGNGRTTMAKYFVLQQR